MRRASRILVAAMAALFFAGAVAAEDKPAPAPAVPAAKNLRAVAQEPGIEPIAVNVTAPRNLKPAVQERGAITVGQAGLSKRIDGQLEAVRRAGKQQKDFMRIVSENLVKQEMLKRTVPAPQVGYATMRTAMQQLEFGMFVSANLSSQSALTPKPPVSVADLHAAEAAPLLRQSVVEAEAR